MNKAPRNESSKAADSSDRKAIAYFLAKHCSTGAEYSKRLLSYSTAAGLGAFLSGQSADAEIIYVDLGDSVQQKAANTYINLDLDANGTTDFVFGQTTLRYTGVRLSVFGHPLSNPPEDRVPVDQLSRNFTNSPAKGNAYYIRSFSAGASIGPGLTEPTLNNGYPNFSGIVATNATNFGNLDTPQYWGFGLNIDGEVHYGWGRLSTTRDGNGDYTIALHEYAYQSEPDVAIVAGEVPVPEASSLALLAAGCGGLGLAARRQRRDNENQPQ
jgi:hypothetical protein